MRPFVYVHTPVSIIISSSSVIFQFLFLEIMVFQMETQNVLKHLPRGTMKLPKANSSGE